MGEFWLRVASQVGDTRRVRSASNSRKPYDFLMVSFALLFRPSTTPAEIVPLARNQFEQQRLDACASVRADLLQRLEPRPHRAGAPLVEEPAGPGRRSILPEPLEVLAMQIGPHALQVVLQQLRQLDRLVRSVRFSGRLSRHQRECLSTGS